jgi:hypothetical protein
MSVVCRAVVISTALAVPAVLLTACGRDAGTGGAIASAGAQPANASPATASGALRTAAMAPGDGQTDFDWEIGEWRTELSLLLHPLTDSARWVAFEGTTVVRKVWDGAANLVELVVAGPTGRIEGLSLRLYDPLTRQWSLNFANRRIGRLVEPTVGRFADGRGLFLGQSTLADGRPVHVRFEIMQVEADVWRFEQAFSADGGRTWEVNWVAIDTRVSEGAAR